MPLQRPQASNPDCPEAGLRPLTPEPGAQAYSQGVLTETGKHAVHPGQVSPPARARDKQKPHKATFRGTRPQSPQNAVWRASLPCAGHSCLTCPGKPCFGFGGQRGARGHAPFSFLCICMYSCHLHADWAYPQRVLSPACPHFRQASRLFPSLNGLLFPFSHYELRSVVQGTRRKMVLVRALCDVPPSK